MGDLNIGSALKSGLQPNFWISLLVALVILALINSMLPANYKLGKLIGGLYA